MRAIKLAGLVAILLAPVAMATDAEVYFNVSGSAASADYSVTYDTNSIPATGDRWLDWSYAVRVTGDNQGFAGYSSAMGVWQIMPDSSEVVPLHPFASDGSADWWIPAYKSIKTGANGTVVDDGANGGPGLSAMKELGTTNPLGAYISGMGAGLLTYTNFRKAGTLYFGNQTWGVGMDSRKTNLLMDPTGNYDLIGGRFDLTGWDPGTYKVALKETGSVAVLQSGINLNTTSALSGVTWNVPDANVHTAFFTFTIVPVPEPATMLLVAGAGLLIRRRRA